MSRRLVALPLLLALCVLLGCGGLVQKSPTGRSQLRLFPASEMEALLRYGDTGSPALTCDHCARSASTGSTRVARRAGKNAAATPTHRIVRNTTAKATYTRVASTARPSAM